MSDIPKPFEFTSERSALAYENKSFLNGPDGRALRILSEYMEPLARFRHERVQDTVVFFGSARFVSSSAASEGLKILQKPGGATLAPPHEQDKLKRAETAVDMARYYEDARRLARILTEWSLQLKSKRHRFVVTTGGGPGIMEAANLGAREAGGKTIGLNISLPFEQVPNPYISPELNFEFHYFFMRKLWFAYLARALVVFPGGFGTLDELTEILTLQQTGKLARRTPILLYGSTFWNEVLNFDALVRHGTIAREDLDLFTFADDPDTALGLLRSWLRPEPEEPTPAF